MTNSERASYIRGLMDGMELDPNAKETKLFHAIVELLGSMCVDLDELQEGFEELSEQVDEVDQDLGSLEEDYYGLDEAEDEEDCGCGHHHHGGHEGCGCGCHHHGHEAVFEAICPNCGETIELTEEMLEEEKMLCPSCGETLEFDFDEDELEELDEMEPSEEESGEEE